MNKLYQLIYDALSSPNEELGDRSKYIGSSDLGCPYQTYHNKKNGAQPKTLSQLLVLRRGEMVEAILKKAFSNCPNVAYQKEYQHPEIDYIKSHLDFEFFGKDTIGVLECKSIGKDAPLPKTPYQNWNDQLNMQMGLSHLNNPTKLIKGVIVAINITNGEFKIFDGYQYNETSFNKLVQRAQKIYHAIQNSNYEDLEAIQSPICNYCQHKIHCPSFFYVKNEEILDLTYLNDIVSEFLQSQIYESEAKQTKQTAQQAIQEAFNNYKLGICNIDGEDIRLKKVDVEKYSFNEKLFKDEHPDLYDKYLRKSSYSYIRVQ